MQCTICKTYLAIYSKEYAKLREINCPRCGNYKIDSLTSAKFNKKPFYHPFSSWIREQNTYLTIPHLQTKNIDDYFLILDKSITLKYEFLLKKAVAEKSIYFYNIKDTEQNHELNSICWCEEDSQLKMLLKKAMESNHLVKKPDNLRRETYDITFDGIEYVENLSSKINSNKIFMAFHFEKDMKEQFEPAVRKAVLDASGNKLEVVRVSSTSTNYDTKIDDELIGMIKSSKAVIADFTGNRPSVYYEAGYAMGLGIPIIWTCRETDIHLLSFDTRQYPHIIWKDEKDLYTQVLNRIKAKVL